MQRHFEYTDSDGKRWGAQQHLPHAGRESTQALIRRGDMLLSHTAHTNGWTDIEVFDPAMPVHEVKARINAIQRQNDNPEPYSEDETKPQELRPVVVAITRRGPDGESQTVETPIAATSAAVPMTPPIAGSESPEMPVPIRHATAAPAVPAPTSIPPAPPLPGTGT